MTVLVAVLLSEVVAELVCVVDSVVETEVSTVDVTVDVTVVVGDEREQEKFPAVYSLSILLSKATSSSQAGLCKCSLNEHIIEVGRLVPAENL